MFENLLEEQLFVISFEIKFSIFNITEKTCERMHPFKVLHMIGVKFGLHNLSFSKVFQLHKIYVVFVLQEI